MGTRSGTIAASIAAIAATAGTIAHAEDKSPAEILEPTSPWRVEFADDSCRLIRTFGEKSNSTLFFIERFDPGDHFNLAIASNSGLLAGDTRFVRFGPGGVQREQEFARSVPEYAHTIMLSGTTLVDISSAERPKSMVEADMRTIVTPEQEVQIQWVDVWSGKSPPLRLALGSMGQPMKAMRACTDDLLSYWGVDAKALSKSSRDPVPIGNPGNWANAADYPRDMLKRNYEGLVHFRLVVGADGRPTKCTVQRSSRPKGFDETTCRILMGRARFEPALDEQGQPLASYWRSSVRWEIP